MSNALNDNLQAVDGFEMTYIQADDSLTHRFMVPRMLPPTPFVGNSDILVPSPIVSFILTLPKQPQSTEKENENMPLSRDFLLFHSMALSRSDFRRKR